MDKGNALYISRRKFLKLAGIAASAALLTGCGLDLTSVAENNPAPKTTQKRTIKIDPLPTLVPTATVQPTLTATPEPITVAENQLRALLGKLNKEWRITKETINGVTRLGLDALTRAPQSIIQWYAPIEVQPTPTPFTPVWKNVLKINQDGTAAIKSVDYYSDYHNQPEITFKLADIQYDPNIATLVLYDQQKNYLHRFNQVVGTWVDNRLDAGFPVYTDINHIREVIPWINPELLANDKALDFIASFNKQMVALEKKYIADEKIQVGNYDSITGSMFISYDTLPFPISRLVGAPKVSVVFCPALGANDHDKFIWGMAKDQAKTNPAQDAIIWRYITIDDASFAWYSTFGEQKRYREVISSRANFKQLLLSKINRSSVTFFAHGSSMAEVWHKPIAIDDSKGWAWFFDLYNRFIAAKIDIYALFNNIFADVTLTPAEKNTYCTFIQDNCWLPALDTGTNLY